MQKTTFKIKYESKDITRAINPYVLSIDYTDNEHGQSDEIVIQLENSDKLWQGNWYPSKGDVLSLEIGYEGEKLLNCGAFEIDEIEYSAPPDVITLKAVSTNIKKTLRENNSVAYENKTLKQIAQEIADKHDLELVGQIQEVKVQRITQNQERDLTFLKNLAEQYGYIFKIADNKLVFYETKKLKNATPNVILTKQDLTSISLREKTHEIYKACEISYHNPESKAKITVTVQDKKFTFGDVLKISSRCENKEQAVLQAHAALDKKNSSKISGSISLPGSPNLVAGINLELKKTGNFSGKYHITQVKHRITKSSGYTTSGEIENA